MPISDHALGQSTLPYRAHVSHCPWSSELQKRLPYGQLPYLFPLKGKEREGSFTTFPPSLFPRLSAGRARGAPLGWHNTTPRATAPGNEGTHRLAEG